MANYENNDNSADMIGQEEKRPVSPKDIRYAAWFILVIAAIFVINAMESGSYRTPWPVALLTSVVGLGLLGYSFVKEGREGRKGS